MQGEFFLSCLVLLRSKYRVEKSRCVPGAALLSVLTTVMHAYAYIKYRNHITSHHTSLYGGG